jgi:hypothetical protein
LTTQFAEEKQRMGEMKLIPRCMLFSAAAILAVGVALPRASAQTDPTTQPSTQPQDDSTPGPTGMSAQEMLDQMLRAGSGQGNKALQPLPEGPNPFAASTASALLPGGQATFIQPTTRPATAAGLREGSYIVNRTGHLQRHDGDTLLVLDKLPTEKRPISLLVLPNLKRLAMEQAIASVSRTLIFRNLNGTVTEYRGKNWVLLTLDPAVDSSSTNPMVPPPPAPAPPPSAPAQPTRTMSAEDVLGNMLRPAAPTGGAGSAQPLAAATDGTGMNAATGVGAVAPGAPQMQLLREGTFIVDRVGRLTKSPDGSRSEFTFETDGRAMEDPPLILMPCVKTSTMEDSVKLTNQDLKFRVTGLTTEYRGRNYLLPDRVVVIPDAAQQF